MKDNRVQVLASTLAIEKCGDVQYLKPVNVLLDFNPEVLLQDVDRLLAVGMTLDQVIQSLPLGKYIKLISQSPRPAEELVEAPELASNPAQEKLAGPS